MATALARPPAVERDTLRARAARVTRECASSQALLASATGKDPSRVSRWCNGDEHAPAFRALEFCDALARHAKTTPIPLIVAMQSINDIAEAEHKPTPVLVRRWRELHEREPLADAQQKVAALRYGPEHERRQAFRRAHRREAELQIEIAVIDEVLEARGVDPRAYPNE